MNIATWDCWCFTTKTRIENQINVNINIKFSAWARDIAHQSSVNTNIPTYIHIYMVISNILALYKPLLFWRGPPLFWNATPRISYPLDGFPSVTCWAAASSSSHTYIPWKIWATTHSPRRPLARGTPAIFVHTVHTHKRYSSVSMYVCMYVCMYVYIFVRMCFK